MLTLVCGGARSGEELRGERQGNHHTPSWDGQAPIIPSFVPHSLLRVGAYNWTFVLCVNSSPAHTFPDCVQLPNRWGLYPGDTHTHTHTSLPRNIHTECTGPRDMSHAHARSFSCVANNRKKVWLALGLCEDALYPWVCGSQMHRTFSRVFVTGTFEVIVVGRGVRHFWGKGRTKKGNGLRSIVFVLSLVLFALLNITAVSGTAWKKAAYCQGNQSLYLCVRTLELAAAWALLWEGPIKAVASNGKKRAFKTRGWVGYVCVWVSLFFCLLKVSSFSLLYLSNCSHISLACFCHSLTFPTHPSLHHNFCQMPSLLSSLILSLNFFLVPLLRQHPAPSCET